MKKQLGIKNILMILYVLIWVLLVAFLILSLKAWILQLFFNFVLAPTFGLVEISFFQAIFTVMAIYLFGKILFSKK